MSQSPQPSSPNFLVRALIVLLPSLVILGGFIWLESGSGTIKRLLHIKTKGERPAPPKQTVYTPTFKGTIEPKNVDPEMYFKKVALPNTVNLSVTCVMIGPDHKLYACCDDGRIVRFPIKEDGTLGDGQTMDALQKLWKGPRLLIGLDFKPGCTAENLEVWVTHSSPVFENAPDFSGAVTRLRGKDLEIAEDAVINLPRSIRDHMTFQPHFGPDGALYFHQGSSCAYGAPDSIWGMREQHGLTAAVLRLDTTKVTPGQPIDSKTKFENGTYDPNPKTNPGAPLTIYADGVRVAYDLCWSTDNKLYAAVNGSSIGGATPAGPAGSGIPGIADVTSTEPDWFFQIKPGKYYGHPNPHHGHYVSNGGNPTADVDLFENTQYPVGVKPDANWDPAIYRFEDHTSANGTIQYSSNAFSGKLKGKFIVCRYNYGADLIVLTVDEKTGEVDNDKIIVGIPGTNKLRNPLDLCEDKTNGNLYVSEFGSQKITLLKPSVRPATQPTTKE